MKKDLPNTRLSQGAFTYFLGIPGKFAGFLVMWILARFYGPNELSLYVSAWATIQVLHLVSAGGAAEAVNLSVSSLINSKDQDKNKGQDKSNPHPIYKEMAGPFVIGASLSLISFGVLQFVLPFIQSNLALFDEHFIHALKILSITIPLQFIIQYFVSTLRGILVVKYDMIINSIVKQTLFMSIVISAIFFPEFSERLLWFQVGVYLISSLIAVHAFTKWFEISSLFQNLSFRDLPFSRVISLSINDALNQLIQELDIIVLAFIALTQDVDIAFYGVALSIVFGLRMMRKNMVKVFVPLSSSNFARGKFQQINLDFNNTQRWVLYLTLPLLSLFIIYPDRLLSLYGADYLSFQTEFVLLVWVAMADAFLGSFNAIFIANHQTWKAAKNSFVVVMLNLILNLILIPQMGIRGAALATLIGLVMSQSWIYLQVRQSFPSIQLHLPSIIRPVFVILIPALGMTFLRDGSIIRDLFILIMWPLSMLLAQSIVGFSRYDQRIFLKNKLGRILQFGILIKD